MIRVSALKALEGDPEWVAKVEELMEAVDTYIPDPVRETDKPFLMPIEDVFTITGRGTVVTGRAERGTLKINSEVEIVGIRPIQKTTVTGIEMFHKRSTKHGQARTVVCFCVVSSVTTLSVVRLLWSRAPSPLTPSSRQTSTSSPRMRRSPQPFYSNYRPQFYFRTTDVTGVIKLPEGTEMVMPGDNTEMTVELIQPIAMEEGLGFAIREGGRTVGSGRVTKIIK